jgi:taurine dioxygenase
MIDVRPLDAPFGAEIAGLDLTKSISAEDFRPVHDAFLQYGVLVFRDQELTPEQHIAFSRHFAPLLIHPIESQWALGYPELLQVPDRENVNADTGKIAQLPWHSDLTYAERPCLGVLLYGKEVPPSSEGGATGFVDIIAVYDALPAPLKARIENLEMLHRFEGDGESEVAKRITALISPEDYAKLGVTPHPLVITHPELGRKALNISCLYAYQIVGLEPEESRQLIAELSAFAAQDRFVLYHEWRRFDLVAWDNRRTMHCATGHSGKYPRIMQKTTLIGDFYRDISVRHELHTSAA